MIGGSSALKKKKLAKEEEYGFGGCDCALEDCLFSMHLWGGIYKKEPMKGAPPLPRQIVIQMTMWAAATSELKDKRVMPQHSQRQWTQMIGVTFNTQACMHRGMV